MTRALLISTENPFPADSGGRLRLRSILDVLARRFAIDLVTYAREENAKYRRGPDTAQRRPGAAHGHAAGGGTAQPLPPAQLRLHGSRRSRHDAAGAGALHDPVVHDTVFIDNTVLGYFIPPLRRLQPSARFVTIAHNFETSLCQQLADVQHGVARRALFRLSALTRQEELRVCRQSDLLLSTSSAEARAFATINPAAAAKTVVVPSCIDASSYAHARHRSPDDDSIVFSGDMSYFPNVAAARHFLSAIYPALKRAAGHPLLAGRPPIRIRAAQAPGRRDPSSTVTGWVEAPRRTSRAARWWSAWLPARQPGARFKILEAWAVDGPVVATAKDCEGLECRPTAATCWWPTSPTRSSWRLRYLAHAFAARLAQAGPPHAADSFDIDWLYRAAVRQYRTGRPGRSRELR